MISYIKERRGRELESTSERVQQLDLELQELNQQLDTVRGVITDIQKEINESGASVANLRDNIRARRLIRQIGEVQAEIESHDMEEMAKARRNFEEKYKLAKEKEDNLRVEVGTYTLSVIRLLITHLCHASPLSPHLPVLAHSQYGRLRGELDTLQQQVEKYDMDLKKNYKDINKRYTDQLIRVKVELRSNLLQ